MLERLLAGMSPAARRGVTIALIAIAWVGFLVAVLGGLLAGITIIVVGFVGCWLVVATISGKKGDDAREAEPLLRENPVEPDDVQARVQRRLEALNQQPPETGDSEDA